MAEEVVALLLIEELLDERRILDRERVWRDRTNPFEINDIKFVRLFRLTKPLVHSLVEQLRPFIPPPLLASGLTVETKIFVCLRFMATGSYQLPVGQDKELRVSQSSVSRILNQVTKVACAQLLHQWVKFPVSIEEQTDVKRKFLDKFNFPGVLGVVDGTHIAIAAPQAPRNDEIDDDREEFPEHIYVNRKGFHSLNVQLICDADLKITNVNAKFPGSSHDSFIWRQSNVRDFLEESFGDQRNGSGWLLGDSGYPLEPWLMNCVSNAQPRTAEERFNRRLSTTRSLIERLNGVLKARFRCLLQHRTLHYHPTVAARIVNTCVILHNMCVHHNVLIPEEENDDPDDPLDVAREIDVNEGVNVDRIPNVHNIGQRTRAALIARNFR